MGSFINSITQPITGLKLFPGGPYGDDGKGDKALTNADILQQYGMSFLQGGGSLPDVQNMGYLQYVPDLLKQMASAYGLGDPFAGGTGGVQDQYSLTGAQGEEFSNTASQINAARKTAVERAKSRLNAQGLGDSTTMAAAEQSINDKFDSMLQSEHSKARSSAFDERMAMLQSLTGAMQGLYGSQIGQQMDYAGLGTNMLGGSTNIYSNAAANAQAQSNQTGSFWQSLLGAGLGALTNPYKNSGSDNYQSPYLGGVKY